MKFRMFGICALVTFGCLQSVAAAQSAPKSMQIKVGSASGALSALSQAGDGRYVKLYSSNAGNLQALFVIPTAGLGNGLKLNAVFRQKTASDVFFVQVSDASGAFTSIGSFSGSLSAQSGAFSVPAIAIVKGQVTVRLITGPNSNDSALDYLMLADSGSTAQPTPAPTPNPTPQPASQPTPISGGAWWQPTGPLEWQWEIDHPLNLQSAADMGTGKTAYSGASAPATDPMVYDIDGFDNPASTVSALHALGKKVVCYIEVGAAENYRPDYSQFTTAALGNVMPGYSSERYVDIRNPQVVQIIEARIAMCAGKGFDAIEPDIDESYGASTGFPLTKADEEAFMKTLAAYAHGLGVAMWGKNPDDTGDSYAQDMVGVFDAVLTEECNQYGTCGSLSGYKAVFNAEYSGGVAAFCPADNSRGAFSGVLFPLSLNGPRTPCR